MVVDITSHFSLINKLTCTCITAQDILSTTLQYACRIHVNGDRGGGGGDRGRGGGDRGGGGEGGGDKGGGGGGGGGGEIGVEEREGAEVE